MSSDDKDDLDNAHREISEELGIPLEKMQPKKEGEEPEIKLYFIST